MIIFWTPTKIRLLKQYWTDGLTARDIGVKLGTTRNAVIGKAHRMKLRPRTNEQSRHLVKVKPKPKPEPKPKPQPEPRSTKATPPRLIVNPVVPKGDAGVATMALVADSCRWPMGDPCTDRFMYCQNKKIEDYPYCDEHCRTAYHEFGLPRHRRKTR
jgi:GcrA cell cycle regulator